MSQYSKPFDPTKNPLVLAIEHFEKEIVIGHIGLSQYDDEFAEIGYAIGDRYKKMGFASEAVKALSSWAVEFKKLKKIMGVVSKENVGSYKVLKNAKYKLIEEKEMNYLGKNTLCQLYSYP